jgi:hypothetical protein
MRTKTFPPAFIPLFMNEIKTDSACHEEGGRHFQYQYQYTNYFLLHSLFLQGLVRLCLVLTQIHGYHLAKMYDFMKHLRSRFVLFPKVF